MNTSFGNSWPFWKKAVFVFFVVFLSLNCFPISKVLTLLDSYLVGFLADKVFHINYTYENSGSGDTTVNYLELFIAVCLTFILCPLLLWILNMRVNFDKLSYWFRVYVRYYLATVMFSYGIAKVLKMQFSDLSLDTLLTTYGNSSPMGLAWRFMGYSDLYCKFTGYTEMIAGILLLFPKTTLLGALFGFGIMFNVMMMNFGFDIPVKLFSTQLAVVSLYIIAPDLKRLMDFFFLDKTVSGSNLYKPVFSKSLHITKTIIKWLIVLFLFGTAFFQYFNGDDPNSKRPPLYGIYHVTSFSRNNKVIPPIVTDSACWKTVVVGPYQRANIRFCNDSIELIGFRADTVKKIIDASDQTKVYKWNYTFSEDKLSINGIFGGDTLKVEMRKYDEQKFLIKRRGFHWINEFPFNR